MDHLIDPKVLLDTPTMPSNNTPTMPSNTHPDKSTTSPPAPVAPPSTKAQPKNDPTPSKKLPKKEKDETRSPPHTWTTEQRSTLLELIAEQNALGQSTDNGGMKKEAWSIVIQKLNAKHGLNLSSEQVKNQKNAFRKLFFDYKFLRAQSGFGWDDDKGVPTADERVWNELFEEHPRREFAKLKGKPFPLYDLAASVWEGTAATGDFAESALPPTSTNAVKLSASAKRKLMNAEDEDSDVELEPSTSVQTNTTATTKRVRESKNQIIKSEMESINGAIAAVTETSKDLVGAFSKIASAMSAKTTNDNIKNEDPPTQSILTSKGPSDMALDICADRFLGKVPDDIYIEFVSILEDELKAQTFLSLSRNSNERICLMWLQKEVKKSATQ
jgi:hypothetical protein